MTRTERYANQYCEEYLPKVFYFCLRKTGNEHDAEELAGEISLEILTALHAGTEPRSFPAWVWQIARNRFARFARSRYYSPLSMASLADTDELAEVLPDGSDLVSDLIVSDEKSRLRRELAFIRSDYRNILLAHYFEEKSVSAIAQAFDLPVGTVKTKLIHARKQLKEGMSMAREFGVRSYKPEQIAFINNGISGRLGQPWTILNHALYKNVFLELYGNPETAEELSLELGVALPYMEDELNYLVEQTFLCKTGKTYETTFPILSADAQKKMHEGAQALTPRLTVLLAQLADRYAAACDAVGIRACGPYVTEADARWTLLMVLLDRLDCHFAPYNQTERPDGGVWDIVGLQNTDWEMPRFVGLHGACDSAVSGARSKLAQYKYQYQGLDRRTPVQLDYEEAMALRALVLEGKACSEALQTALLKHGYLVEREGEITPSLALLDKTHVAALSDADRAALHELAEEARALLRDYAKACREIILADLPARFRQDDNAVAMTCAGTPGLRGYVLEQALKDGWLVLNDETARTVGGHLFV